jgi:hypothetical protein
MPDEKLNMSVVKFASLKIKHIFCYKPSLLFVLLPNFVAKFFYAATYVQ